MEASSIKLGNTIYKDLSTIVPKTDFQLIRNYNQVYVNVNNTMMSDLLQLPYDPNRKQFLLGKLKELSDSSTGSGEITERNVYIRVVTGSADDDVSGGDSGGGGSSSGDSGSSGGGSVVTVNLDNPDYAALLELLNVLQVSYDDDPVNSLLSSTATSGGINQSTGFRFKWVLTNSGNNYITNCIRIKNFSTGGTRYDGGVYLKVLEYYPQEFSDDFGYGKLGDAIFTVSSNAVNQAQNNELNQWYEWYFPKNIEFKPNYIYVIIPHHDKSYEEVTQSDAKLIVFSTSDTNAATNTMTGVWTGNRQSEVNVRQNPIIQFCYKKPTTVIVKR